MLTRNDCNASCFVPTNLPATVAALDFTAIKRKLLDPSERNGFCAEQVALAELEYRRFLALCVWHPDAELVPSRLVDDFWHPHILDTMAYVRDCESIFGGYLHHYPYMGMGSPKAIRELENAFQKTKALYEEYFGPYPEGKMAAARCGGHKCHSPSPCACRTPGACKNHIGATAPSSHLSD
jgi:hypothetical protein